MKRYAMKDHHFIIKAKNFTNGNLQGFNPEFKHLVLTNEGSRDASFAEYTFSIDQRAQYKLYFAYATLDARPTDIFIDGKLLKKNALQRTTGGWSSDALCVFFEAETSLSTGPHILKIERQGPIPHIKELIFIKKGLTFSDYVSEGNQSHVLVSSEYFTICAKYFSQGNLQRLHEEWLPLVVDGGKGFGNAEYEFFVDQDAVYQLYSVYAALDSRPVDISIDGRLLKKNALHRTTGGWASDATGVFLETEVGLSMGLHCLKIEREGLIPHIKELVFVKPGSDPSICFDNRKRYKKAPGSAFFPGKIMIPPEIETLLRKNELRKKYPDLMERPSETPVENTGLSDVETDLQPTVYLYGHSPEVHRWGVNLLEQDFDRQLTRLKHLTESNRDHQVVIGVRRTNFHRLMDIVSLVQHIRQNRTGKKLDNFSITPFRNIKRRFAAYLRKANKVLNPVNIYLQRKDKDLDRILEIIEDNFWRTLFNRDDFLRALGPVCKDVFVGPYYLLFNLSGLCNTDCIYCRKFSSLLESKWKRKALDGRQQLDFKVLKGVLKDAKSIKTKKILIVGEGEPLLYPYFKDVLVLLKKYGFRFNFSTNGMLLNKYNRYLTDGTCSTVTVSMSYATPGTFQKIRPRTALKQFKVIEDNIKTLVRLKGRTSKKTPAIVLLHAINKLNYHEIVDMAHKAKELGADALWFQLVHLEAFSYHHLKLDDAQMRTVKAKLSEARKLCKGNGIKFASFIDFEMDHYNPTDGDWSHKGLLEQGCFVGWHFAYIDLKEVISFCCGRKIIGLLTDRDGLKEAWYSDIYNRYRNDGIIMHRENPRDLYGKPLYDKFCDSCDNHDQNNQMINLLKAFHLFEFVER